jgi:quercetin dioxygenase-like cupin family protein
LKHHYAEGSYAREMLIPKGAIIIGKIHRHSHVNVISKGRIYVATEFGSEILQAPYTFISKPGTKRAVYALEDTVWTTIHVTEETDLEKIEEVVIAPDYETFEREQRLLK